MRIHTRGKYMQPKASPVEKQKGKGTQVRRPVTHPFRDGMVHFLPGTDDRTTFWPILIVGSLQT